jgi:hypothetical protein
MSVKTEHFMKIMKCCYLERVLWKVNQNRKMSCNMAISSEANEAIQIFILEEDQESEIFSFVF